MEAGNRTHDMKVEEDTREPAMHKDTDRWEKKGEEGQPKLCMKMP